MAYFKFEAGDRVRTVVASNAAASDRTGTIVGATNCNLGWDVLMDDEPRKPTDFAGWYYHDDELELIEETPTFKAGDRVRTVMDFSHVPAGAVGVVQSAEPTYYIRVVIKDYPYDGTDNAWPFQACELEPIKETDSRDRALDEIRDIVKCAFGRRYDAIQAIEVQIPNILRETGRMQ